MSDTWKAGLQHKQAQELWTNRHFQQQRLCPECWQYKSKVHWWGTKKSHSYWQSSPGLKLQSWKDPLTATLSHWRPHGDIRMKQHSATLLKSSVTIHLVQDAFIFQELPDDFLRASLLPILLPGSKLHPCGQPEEPLSTMV